MSETEETQAVDHPEGEGFAPEPESNQIGSGFKDFFSGTQFWIFVALLGMVAVFAILRPEAFMTTRNLRNVLIDASALLIVATGMTFVIITAGIDLSVGMVTVFSGVIAAMTMVALGSAGWGTTAAGVAAGLATGTGWGVLNGLLITKARIPPLIVTLGTLGMALGGAQLLTDGVNIRGSAIAPELGRVVGFGRLFGVVPHMVILAVLVALIGGLVLHTTRFGRYTYAIGSDVEAARRAGINVDRHLVKVYALQGFLAGMAALVTLARFTSTNLAGHRTDNLQAIAAVVIGGTSLFGGVGTVFGSMVGVLIPSVLKNGFVILRLSPFWQEVAVGAVLIIAVYVDQIRRRRRTQL